MSIIHPVPSRRHFFQDCGLGLGTIALANLLSDAAAGRAAVPTRRSSGVVASVGNQAGRSSTSASRQRRWHAAPWNYE